MKLILVIYSGANPQSVPELLEQHQVSGYTELAGAHGAGRTGRREGTRAWPGDTSIYFSVVPADRVEPLTAALKETAAALEPGERLHVSVLPAENFF
jgi:hypothetical protein